MHEGDSGKHMAVYAFLRIIEYLDNYNGHAALYRDCWLISVKLII